MSSSEKNTEQSYRLAVIRIGLALTWLSLGAYLWLASLDGPPRLEDRSGILIAAGAVTLALTFAPWRWLLQRLLGDIIVVAWVAAIALAVAAYPELANGQLSTYILLASAAFSTAALLSWPAAVSSVLVVLFGFIASELPGGGDLGLLDPGRTIGFSVTLGMIVLGQVALSRRVLTANTRLAQAERAHVALAAREAELDQIYAVSRTIGTGRDLSEVLPELVGRVVNAVGARTGLVLLHDPDRRQLRVMSPIWVGGLPLRAAARTVSLDSRGFTQRVFLRAEPAVLADIDRPDDAALRELDVNQVVGVPLSAGTELIGVMVVGDRRDEPFDDRDVATVQSLAGPAALVLNQLTRYEQAREMSERMADLAQLKTDFVSVVSHELRTPLTSIIGSLHTLQRPQLAPRDPDGVVLLDTAARQANRLKALIEDLLVVSRIDNRALPVRSEQVDLRHVIDSIVESIPGAAQFVRAAVADSAREVVLDPEHLRRILTNLIENALRYAPRAPIHVTAHSSAGDVLISVADTGPGIPADDADRVFDRFTQLERREGGGRRGTGLGLSIVRGLAETMGGRVWYEPTKGGGATFVVAIPLRARHRRASSV